MRFGSCHSANRPRSAWRARASSGGVPSSNPRRAVSCTNRRYATWSSIAAIPHTAPWPGTRTSAPKRRIRSSAASEPGDRAHHHERRAAVEDQVAGEQDASLRKPGDHVVRRVGRTDELQLHFPVVHVEVQVVVEADERWRHLEPPPVDTREKVRGDVPAVDHLLTAPVVADDRRGGHEVVAVGVVAVMMGVDERAQRPRRHRLDRVDQRTGTPLGEAGVDDGHSVAADEEAAVVQSP